MTLEPSLVLSVLVGLFHTALYVAIRGSAGSRLPIVAVAAVLGAWAGDALSDRLGFRILTIGDFHLLGASIVAWIGIGLSSLISVLGPSRKQA